MPLTNGSESGSRRAITIRIRIRNTAIMERLDQGHLYPFLEPETDMSHMTRVSTVGGDHSSKELFEQLFNSYSEHLHELATLFLFYFLSSFRTKEGLKYRIAVVADPDTASKTGDTWTSHLQ